MNIPKSYEALAADLASEKILSKTLIGQKEAYMMLADHLKLDLATWKQKACEAAEREAALREEIGMAKQVQEATDAIVTMMDGQRDHWIEKCGLLKQRLAVAERRESEAMEELLDLSRKLDVFYSRSHGIKNLSAIEDANDKSKALQQRLTVAEQLVQKMVDCSKGQDSIATGYLSDILAELKPAETLFEKGQRLFREGHGSSSLWGECSNDAELPEVHRGWMAAYDAAALKPADHPQCEECKGWGYHENHYEGGGTECGGSGNATVTEVMVMPDRMKVEPFTTIDRGSKSYKAGYNAAIAEVAKLNGLKT